MRPSSQSSIFMLAPLRREFGPSKQTVGNSGPVPARPVRGGWPGSTYCPHQVSATMAFNGVDPQAAAFRATNVAPMSGQIFPNPLRPSITAFCDLTNVRPTSFDNTDEDIIAILCVCKPDGPVSERTMEYR